MSFLNIKKIYIYNKMNSGSVWVEENLQENLFDNLQGKPFNNSYVNIQTFYPHLLLLSKFLLHIDHVYVLELPN